jgi:acyl-CoA oxidase
MYEELTKGKFKTLDILHHYTSGLKSIYSQSCYDGLDQIRQSCGGAGYSAHSLLPQLYADYSPVPTYEGDNTVMAQQSLNYLQKKLKQIKAGKKATGVLSYLNNIDTLCNIKSDATTVATFSDLNHLDNALAVRAAYKVRDVLGKLENTKEKKVVLLNDIYAQEIV